MRRLLALTLTLTFASAAMAEDGPADIWKAKCKGCHGDDGKGKTKVGMKEKIDDLSSPEWQAKHTDDDIRTVIAEGSTKNTKMKGYKDRLSAEEIGSLVKYVRSLKAK